MRANAGENHQERTDNEPEKMGNGSRKSKGQTIKIKQEVGAQWIMAEKSKSIFTSAF